MKKIFLLAVVIVFLAGCNRSGLELIPGTASQEKGNVGFVMNSGMRCTIDLSTNNAEQGNYFDLSDLNTSNAKITYAGQQPIPLSKIYDNEGKLIMQRVSGGTANVETILLNKETGIFAKTSVGDFWAPFAVAAKGRCK